MDQKKEGTFGSLDGRRAARKPLLPLLAHVLRFFSPPGGLTIETHSESPAGGGIAGSSALIIAICSALNKLTRSGHSLEKIREIAQNIEAQIIRVPTGAQDYYPALYGGVSAIELGCAGIRRVSIPVDPDDLTERTVLAYTGEPRNSGINNWEVTKAYIDGDRKVHRNFEQISSIANGMRGGRRRLRVLPCGTWREGKGGGRHRGGRSQGSPGQGGGARRYRTCQRVVSSADTDQGIDRRRRVQARHGARPGGSRIGHHRISGRRSGPLSRAPGSHGSRAGRGDGRVERKRVCRPREHPPVRRNRFPRQ